MFSETVPTLLTALETWGENPPWLPDVNETPARRLLPLWSGIRVGSPVDQAIIRRLHLN